MKKPCATHQRSKTVNDPNCDSKKNINVSSTIKNNQLKSNIIEKYAVSNNKKVSKNVNLIRKIKFPLKRKICNNNQNSNYTRPISPLMSRNIEVVVPCHLNNNSIHSSNQLNELIECSRNIIHSYVKNNFDANMNFNNYHIPYGNQQNQEDNKIKSYNEYSDQYADGNFPHYGIGSTKNNYNNQNYPNYSQGINSNNVGYQYPNNHFHNNQYQNHQYPNNGYNPNAMVTQNIHVANNWSAGHSSIRPIPPEGRTPRLENIQTPPMTNGKFKYLEDPEEPFIPVNPYEMDNNIKHDPDFNYNNRSYQPNKYEDSTEYNTGRRPPSRGNEGIYIRRGDLYSRQRRNSGYNEQTRPMSREGIGRTRDESPGYERRRRSPSNGRRRKSPSYEIERKSPKYDSRRRSPSYERGHRSSNYKRSNSRTRYNEKSSKHGKYNI